jgi:hypothetical protein
MAIGVAAKVARRLAAEAPEEVTRQLEYLPARQGLRDPAAAIVAAVQERWPPPPGLERGGPEPERPTDRLRREAEELEARERLAERLLAQMDPEERVRLEREVREALQAGCPGMPVPRAAVRAALEEAVLKRAGG